MSRIEVLSASLLSRGRRAIVNEALTFQPISWRSARISAPPDAFKRLQQHLLKYPGGDREMVEILALVLQHDEQAVLCAVELALSDGAPTKTHVINVLHRLIDGKSSVPPTVDTPRR